MLKRTATLLPTISAASAITKGFPIQNTFYRFCDSSHEKTLKKLDPQTLFKLIKPNAKIVYDDISELCHSLNGSEVSNQPNIFRKIEETNGLPNTFKSIKNEGLTEEEFEDLFDLINQRVLRNGYEAESRNSTKNDKSI